QHHRGRVARCTAPIAAFTVVGDPGTAARLLRRRRRRGRSILAKGPAFSSQLHVKRRSVVSLGSAARGCPTAREPAGQRGATSRYRRSTSRRGRESVLRQRRRRGAKRRIRGPLTRRTPAVRHRNCASALAQTAPRGVPARYWCRLPERRRILFGLLHLVLSWTRRESLLVSALRPPRLRARGRAVSERR